MNTILISQIVLHKMCNALILLQANAKRKHHQQNILHHQG